MLNRCAPFTPNPLPKWYPRQDLHLHQLRALDAASLLNWTTWAEIGASDRPGYLHTPHYKSGSIVRHAGRNRMDAPRGTAPRQYRFADGPVHLLRQGHQKVISLPSRDTPARYRKGRRHGLSRRSATKTDLLAPSGASESHHRSEPRHSRPISQGP